MIKKNERIFLLPAEDKNKKEDENYISYRVLQTFDDTDEETYRNTTKMRLLCSNCNRPIMLFTRASGWGIIDIDATILCGICTTKEEET